MKFKEWLKLKETATLAANIATFPRPIMFSSRKSDIFFSKKKKKKS